MCKELYEETTITSNGGDVIPIEVYHTAPPQIKQWQVRYVNLGEGDDSLRECGKARPCLIVSSNIYNSMSDATITVIPMSKSPMYNCVQDKLMGLRLSSDPSIISILCFNEIKFVNRSLLQNVMCEDINDLIKPKIMEYLYRRLGMDPYIEKTEIDSITDAIQFSEIVQPPKEEEDPKVVIDYMIKKEIAMSPASVNMLSFSQCVQLLECYKTSGIQAFEELPKFNEKTCMAAIKRCKARTTVHADIAAIS